MNQCVILVDNSNIFIQGRKFSAIQKGVMAPAVGKQPSDPSWRIDFGGLLDVLADGRKIHAAVLVGSRPPRNDKMWKAAGRLFTVFLHDRDAANKEKAVDTELVVRGTEIICTAEKPMALVLASGDRDFLPIVRLAQRYGWEVEMCAFESAFSRTGEMAKTVNTIRSLDSKFTAIGHCDFPWPDAPSTP